MVKRTRKPEKKSESIEVRLPHSRKQAFMDACEREGVTASTAIRRFIDAYVARSGRASLKQIIKDVTMTAHNHRLKLTGMTTAMLAAAIGFGTLPSAAGPDAFNMLDRDNNGVITAEEMGGEVLPRLDAGGNGELSREEFEAAKVKTVVINKTELSPGDTFDVTIDGEDIDFDEIEKGMVFLATNEDLVTDGETKVWVEKAEDGSEKRVISIVRKEKIETPDTE